LSWWISPWPGPIAISPHAARLLDISRDALRYKLKKFGLIHAEEDEPSTATS